MGNIWNSNSERDSRAVPLFQVRSGFMILLYSILNPYRFLKVKHTGDIETFKQNYVTKKDTIGMQRLHGLLRTMMIRR